LYVNSGNGTYNRAVKKCLPFKTSVPEITFNQYAQIFTATILEWKPSLAQDAFKDIIISSQNSW